YEPKTMSSAKKATSGKQQGDNKQQHDVCSLPNCGQDAAGQGSHWDGPLCAAHLKRDADRFRESYYSYRQANIDGAMRRVAEQMDLTRGALFELTSDRANASDMFEEILEIVQRCRSTVIGRLDAKIDSMDASLKSLHFFEKLRADINGTEMSGDLVKSFQLSKKMQLALEDAPISDAWTDPVDSSVELVQKLLQETKTRAAIAEDADGAAMRSLLESAVPTANVLLTNYIQFVFNCNRTDGFFYSAQLVSKTQQNGFQALPSSCVLAVGNYGANWHIAFYSNELVVLSQRNQPSNNVVLVSAALVNHQQQIYMLGNNNSLIVTDLAGTQLRTIDNVQFQAEMPIIVNDMEKLYILGDGCINCLSLDTCELQDSMKLSKDTANVRHMTVSGRSLILATQSAVYRMSLSTKRCVKVWQSNSQNVLCVADIGSGFLAACENNGSVALLSSNRQLIKVIDLVPLGVNYLKTCANCGVSYVLQSISCCGASRESSSSFLLICSLSCNDRVLVRVSIC
ncbi:hypothetical protein BOX15_Mlig017959g1, partial [Macrostomum lignano]